MPAGARPGIFLVGVGRGGGVEIYVSLVENLKFKGVSSERFDLKSDLPIDNPHIFAHFRSLLDAYSAYRDEAPERPRKGDYLIVTPWASLPREHLEGLSERFDPVFRTKGSLALPDLSLTRPLNALSWDGVMGFLHQLRRPTWSQSEFVVYSVAVQCNGPVTVTEPAPLSDFAQSSSLRSRPVERNLKPRQQIRLALRVSNPGTQPWPVTTMITSGRWVHLSYHWVNEAGADVIEGARQVLPCGLRPQEETATGLTVTAPGQPGRYRLRLSLVQEGVAWFDQRGGRPLELEFDVVR